MDPVKRANGSEQGIIAIHRGEQTELRFKLLVGRRAAMLPQQTWRHLVSEFYQDAAYYTGKWYIHDSVWYQQKLYRTLSP